MDTEEIQFETDRGAAETIIIDFSAVDIDISSDEFYFTVKSSLDNDADDSAAIIKKDPDDIRIVEKKAYIDLSAADTNIEPKTYYWDIWWKNEGLPIMIASGRYKIKNRPTRRASQ